MEDGEEPRCDASRTRVIQNHHQAVRMRPHVYLGAEPEEPDPPLSVLLQVVGDAVWEVPVAPVLSVGVVVESDRRFRVEDDGSGLPTRLSGPVWQQVPTAVRMFSELSVGHCPPRGVGALVVPTAVCSSVSADIRSLGRGYRVDSGFHQKTRLTDLGPAQGHGTSLEFVLDDDYFPDGSVLPLDPAPAIEAMLDTPTWDGMTRVRGRVDLLIEDRRSGSRVLRTVLPMGTGRCAACHFDCADPLVATGSPPPAPTA
jgi:hypothetical protein